MIIGEVDNIVRNNCQLLSPGGKFVSLEYFNFRLTDMFPKSLHFSQMYNGVQQLLIKSGGDPSIANHIHDGCSH